MKKIPRIKLLIPLIFILLLLSCVISGCGENRGSIEGNVFDRQGQPLAGAVIRAEKSGEPGVILKTDADGSFEIKSVFTGDWVLEFYDSSGLQIGQEKLTVNTNETSRVDFTIGAKPPPENPAKINLNEILD